MIVYRLIKYEGTSAEIAEMFKRSISGVYDVPNDLRITAAPVEPRIVESVPMLLHALQQVSDKRWTPPAQKRAVSSPLVIASRTGAEQEAANMIQLIDSLLEEETSDGRSRYGWAEDTLLGIRETVERTGRVTAEQKRAVENIENARRG